MGEMLVGFAVTHADGLITSTFLSLLAIPRARG